MGTSNKSWPMGGAHHYTFALCAYNSHTITRIHDHMNMEAFSISRSSITLITPLCMLLQRCCTKHQSTHDKHDRYERHFPFESNSTIFPPFHSLSALHDVRNWRNSLTHYLICHDTYDRICKDTLLLISSYRMILLRFRNKLTFYDWRVKGLHLSAYKPLLLFMYVMMNTNSIFSNPSAGSPTLTHHFFTRPQNTPITSQKSHGIGRSFLCRTPQTPQASGS